MDQSETPLHTLVARATFLSNLFSGSQLLSSFELVHGYQPSLFGIPASTVTQELLEAHTQRVATRALQRVLRSRTPNIPTAGMFHTDDDVWVWYASTKHNESNEWIQAKVVATHPQYLEVPRIKNGRPCRRPTMKPAYEDVRLAPRSPLAQTLMSTLEDNLGSGSSSARGEGQQESTHDPRPSVSTMLTKVNPARGPQDDIGAYSEKTNSTPAIIAAELQSEKAGIIEDIYEHVGSQQVSQHKLNFAPPVAARASFC